MELFGLPPYFLLPLSGNGIEDSKFISKYKVLWVLNPSLLCLFDRKY
jgi:hypothetical protein